MGSCGTLDGIRGLDANHLSNTVESGLARTITRITSGNNMVAVAAKAGTAQSGTQCPRGQKKRVLLKRKGQHLYFSSRHHTSFVCIPLRRIGPVAYELEGRLPSFDSWNKFSRKTNYLHFSLKSVSLLTICSKNQECSSRSHTAPLARRPEPDSGFD